MIAAICCLLGFLLGQVVGRRERAERVKALEEALRAADRLIRHVDEENRELKARLAFAGSLRKDRHG